ncbi:MAG: hypothetical protein WB778_01665 [Thermoplasmata archaeon]
MAAAVTSYRSPYTPYPGGSTPSASVTPEEGVRDVRTFAILALVNNVIIGVVGAAAWLLWH